MISQSIVAVALPAGPGPHGRLLANIYLSPRLSGARLLSAFPDWLDWTGVVHRHGLRFDLSCDGRTVTARTDTALLRPDIWQAIFGHDSLVGDYPKPDYADRLLVSYPSRDAHEFLRFAYRSEAAGVGSVPKYLQQLAFRSRDGMDTEDETLSRLRVELWDLQQNQGNNGTVSAQLPAGATAEAAPPSANLLLPPPGIRPMAERFMLYHRLPPAPHRPPLPHTPHQLARLIDFHQALASLTSYPGLLPALGLVFPVELPGDFCPDSPAAGSYLTVQVTSLHAGWSWAHPPTLGTPATGYVRSAAQFAAAPATPPGMLVGGTNDPADIVDGFLALTPTDFHLAGVDLDGALLKIIALANSLATSQDTGVGAGLLPALRSSGLSLLADNRAQILLQAIKDNLGLDAVLSGGAFRPLNARDLTRGYRIDVYSDRRGEWQSLHRRDGTYRFGDGSVAAQTDDEEGFTQLAVVQPAEDPRRTVDQTAAGVPPPGTDLYINERVARWNGWNLSVPRPGTPLNRNPDPGHALDADPTAGQPATSFPMTTSFTVHPASLPTLRFGSRYRIRARAVDLAGHSIPLSAKAADRLALPPSGQLLPYYRYEPVGHPLLVLCTQPGPGGSLAQLVIRSFNSDPSKDATPTADADERHLAPPRAAVQLVEAHGLLDDQAGRLRGDAATYQMVVDRDGAVIPSTSGDPLEPGPHLTVSYFPDPLARGAALTGLPQTLASTDGTVTGGVLRYVTLAGDEPRPYSVTKIPFGEAWPDRAAFRLRLVEGGTPPAWREAERALTVSLPKGHTMQTAVSCYVRPEDLDLLGVWSWMRELFEDADAEALRLPGAGSELVLTAADRGLLTRQVVDGGNEFLTPSLPVTFTHAVQQPLGRPGWIRLPIVHDPGSPIVASALANSFSPITAWRSAGSHHAVLLGALQISGLTTAAVDLHARWTDWIDDLSEPGPSRRPGSGHVERINLVSLGGGPLPADGSGARDVAVYVPSIDTLWFAAPFDQLDGVPSPGRLAAPIHQIGDTKHRVVRYRAVSSSRFQEFFTEPGLVTSRAAAELAVDVPSSARPLAPDIAYVVPSFAWDRQVSTNTKTDVRHGNGLRVYVRRPWYSSGSGELLGVVLWPADASAPDDEQLEAAKAVITQWGLDPVWASSALDPMPTTSVFTAAVRTASGLSLHESAQTVDVAGHQVGYDTGRQLWYCDIELDNPGAYAPFVRLALARYQPRSIPGAELSQVALTDFAQLTPDRSAALTVDPAEPRDARLVVAGFAPDGPTRPYITATVEARRPDIHSDLGWQPARPAQVRVVPDSPAPSQPQSLLFSALIRFARRPTPGDYRLVVREYEVLPVDPPPTALSDKPEFGARLVYASILPFDYPSR